MQKTYESALRAMQQCRLDALKVAQSTQLATLQSTNSFVQMLLAGGPRSMFLRSSTVNDMTEMTTSFAFKLLEQQFAYAKQLTDIFTPPVRKPRAGTSLRSADAAPAALPPPVPVTAMSASEPVMQLAAPAPVVEPSTMIPSVDQAPIVTATIEMSSVEAAPVVSNIEELPVIEAVLEEAHAADAAPVAAAAMPVIETIKGDGPAPVSPLIKAKQTLKSPASSANAAAKQFKRPALSNERRNPKRK